MKRFIALLTVLTLLLGLAGLGRAEDDMTYTGVVKGGSLHLRREASSSGKIINTYPSGTEVEILENDGTWCKVKIGSKTGYMMTQYLTIRPNYPHLGWGRTPDDGTVLNLRAAADPSSAVKFKAMSGATLEVVEDAGSWYKVRAGSVFGYVPKETVTLVEGNFAIGSIAQSSPQDAVTPASLHSAVREVGSAVSLARPEGEFTYSIAYPSLGIPAADGKISAWVQNTLRLFEGDHQQNHAGAAASYTVEYQALRIDERYQSVLLMGRYAVGSLFADVLLALNIDAQAGTVLDNDQLLRANLTRGLFMLEGAVSELCSAQTDGYSCKPDASWTRCAVLGRSGVQVYLPAGLYLPLSLGTRSLTLRYSQSAECLGLDSPTINAFIRTIDPSKPMIALTFDDGPSEETDRILRVLMQYDARATFCVIGNRVEAYRDVLLRTVAAGNEIACHTWSHPNLTEISASSARSQIQRTNDLVREITGGYEIKVLRPPYGSNNKTVRSICADLGMIIAHWEVDTRDWSHRSASKTYNNIIKGAKNGMIVLCHDIYSTTADAAEKAIPELVAKGYQLVTVSELLSFHKDGAKPGTVYSHLDPANIRMN